MHREIPPHEKIRFRRGDIVSLDGLPSAVPVAGLPRRRGLGRRLLRIAGGVVAVLVAVALLVYGALWSGVGAERLRHEAEAAVSRLIGDAYSARIGAVGLSVEGPGSIALRVSDASIATGEGRGMLDAGRIRFGVRFLPLLTGAISVGGVSIDDARVDLGAMPAGGGRLSFVDDTGRIDPDSAIEALFAGARTAVDLLDRQGTDRIELGDVDIVLPGPAGRVLKVRSALLEDGSDGSLSLEADLALAERRLSLKARAARGQSPHEIEILELDIASPAPDVAIEPGARGHRVGAVTLDVHGIRGPDGLQVGIDANISAADVDFGDGDRLVADIGLRLAAVHGTGKVEIGRLAVASGRSNWVFHGAVGPSPPGATPGQDYRFELISDGSTASPAGSPEPALPVVARLAGHVDARGRSIAVDQIGLRTAQGEVKGSADLRFEPGMTPGIDFRLEVDRLPIGHVKQLWPWFAARGARNWVVSNIFGGTAYGGVLALSVPPGRLGNGVPLGPEEVSGRFGIASTRFDVAGRIPPVRDGDGSVAFRGTDVDVALDRGTVYMPSGRTVDASAGTLTIRSAHVRPVIGRLEIDVAGKADAILELASYDPIDVSRFIDLAPADLTGDVSGHVTADIPLQANIPIESLDWRVAFDYDELAIAQPFEDQRVSAAKGSIVVDPTKAVIAARALLNGAAARIDMVEPLGKASPAAKQRKIVLELDDKARRALAPGLDMLLSGTADVELDDSDKARRRIKADLGKAVLRVPWAGWSKGTGVPARVEFAMAMNGGRIDLTDFRLQGETFGATGSISLDRGDVSRVRFPSAKLNRNDDFSLDLKAQGKGYAITIRGKSIDARSVVKLYSQDSADNGAATSSTVPVSVDLAVDAMTGFHGEVLRDVRLAYSGTGARTDRLEFTGLTDTGQTVTYRDVRDGGARKVTMNSPDAGSVLRFLDIYEHMEGGDIALSLAGNGDAPLVGQVDARNFWVVDEPRLKSLVSTPPPNDGRSLNQAVRGDLDTKRVRFERGFAQITKATGSLAVANGVLRGPLIGATFQGSLYDRAGNIEMTGTFMPAYGLNRIFGEIPLVGAILGNGRDRGLIGITFKLAGKAGEPQLQINPLSVIAPGIFRSVFEFR